MTTILLRFFSIVSLLGVFDKGKAQNKLFQPEMLSQHEGKSSIRGISVVNDDVVWVSGSKGTVGITTNGEDVKCRRC